MPETPLAAPAPSDDSPASETAPPARRSRRLREIADTLLLTAIIFLIVNAATGRFLIQSVSMQPTLHEGERVIVDKISYLFRPPARGDIVVLDLQGEPEDLIKRVVGLPGEAIEIKDGSVWIDGQPLDEPYAQPSLGAIAARRLGPDEYFVMCDNRGNSKDSRIFGPIRREDIVGRAWIIYWPPSDWGLVPQPAYAEGG